MTANKTPTLGRDIRTKIGGDLRRHFERVMPTAPNPHHVELIGLLHGREIAARIDRTPTPSPKCYSDERGHHAVIGCYCPQCVNEAFDRLTERHLNSRHDGHGYSL